MQGKLRERKALTTMDEVALGLLMSRSIAVVFFDYLGRRHARKVKYGRFCPSFSRHGRKTQDLLSL